MISANANKLRPMHALENKAVRYVHEQEQRTAVEHLRIKERIGLNPLLICKACNAELELDYSTYNMRKRVDAFCDEHEECKPQRREISA